MGVFKGIWGGCLGVYVGENDYYDCASPKLIRGSGVSSSWEGLLKGDGQQSLFKRDDVWERGGCNFGLWDCVSG